MRVVIREVVLGRGEGAARLEEAVNRVVAEVGGNATVRSGSVSFSGRDTDGLSYYLVALTTVDGPDAKGCPEIS